MENPHLFGGVSVAESLAKLGLRRTGRPTPIIDELDAPRQGGLTESREADGFKILEASSVLGMLPDINDLRAREQLF